MISAPIISLGFVTACSLCGGGAFKLFSVTREPAWLVVGVIAYNLSNLGWIALIGQIGLARATALAVCAQVLGLTAIAALTGERLGIVSWLATALICASLLISSLPLNDTPSAPNATREKPASNPAETVPEFQSTPEGRQK